MKITKENIDDLDISELDLYGTYKLIRKLKMLQKEPRGYYGYTKFVATGKVGFYDYEEGFLQVKLVVYPYLKEGSEPKESCVRIVFVTSDDGDYGGSSKMMSREKAIALVERIKTDILENLEVLPTLEEFNLTLRPYGIQVGYE